MPGSPRIWFATSNQHKFEEGGFVLRGLGITTLRLSSKGEELQSDDPSEIAIYAAKETYRLKRKPLFVEDTGLFIDSLRGFPGTYASFVFQSIGLDGILKLMDGMTSRGAEFVSAVAFCDASQEPKAFVGRLKGRIALLQSGLGGFGFDPIFIPRGRRITLAQMTLAQKCAISHRASALRSFGSWLNLGRSK